MQVKVRVRTILSVDPGIELGLTVCVTSRRYRQTNSSQALRVRVRGGITSYDFTLHFL